LRAVARGEDPLTAAGRVVSDPRVAVAVETANAGDLERAAELAAAGGTCWSTLAVGLCALGKDDYRAGISWAVGLGHDADTNAAVAGALLGCRDGLPGIPQTWLSGLRDRDRLEQAASGLERLT
jgi:ADP-ribosylglycohydrolase